MTSLALNSIKHVAYLLTYKIDTKCKILTSLFVMSFQCLTVALLEQVERLEQHQHPYG